MNRAKLGSGNPCKRLPAMLRGREFNFYEIGLSATLFSPAGNLRADKYCEEPCQVAEVVTSVL